jgi:hypothetical protein
LVRALIPDRGNADPTWTSYARTFFGAIEQLAGRCGFFKIAEPFVPT